MKTISNESYEVLKSSGHVVPRNENGFIIPFVVGKKYEVKSKDNDDLITVKCTQDCPYHLKTI